jgi:hypothetical protein
MKSPCPQLLNMAHHSPDSHILDCCHTWPCQPVAAATHTPLHQSSTLTVHTTCMASRPGVAALLLHPKPCLHTSSIMSRHQHVATLAVFCILTFLLFRARRHSDVLRSWEPIDHVIHHFICAQLHGGSSGKIPAFATSAFALLISAEHACNRATDTPHHDHSQGNPLQEPAMPSRLHQNTCRQQLYTLTGVLYKSDAPALQIITSPPPPPPPSTTTTIATRPRPVMGTSQSFRDPRWLFTRTTPAGPHTISKRPSFHWLQCSTIITMR